MGCVNNKDFFQFLMLKFICLSILGNILPVLHFLSLFHGSKPKRMFTKIKKFFSMLSLTWLIYIHCISILRDFVSVLLFLFVLYYGFADFVFQWELWKVLRSVRSLTMIEMKSGNVCSDISVCTPSLYDDGFVVMSLLAKLIVQHQKNCTFLTIFFSFWNFSVFFYSK